MGGSGFILCDGARNKRLLSKLNARQQHECEVRGLLKIC